MATQLTPAIKLVYLATPDKPLYFIGIEDLFDYIGDTLSKGAMPPYGLTPTQITWQEYSDNNPWGKLEVADDEH